MNIITLEQVTNSVLIRHSEFLNRFTPAHKANFYDVSGNLASTLHANVYLLKDGRLRWSETRNEYLQNLKAIKRYWHMIQKNNDFFHKEINEPESSYFERGDLSPLDYVHYAWHRINGKL